MTNLDEAPTVLFACPLCGGDKGYKLAEGESFRRWDVICAACGERVTECRSDMRTSAGEPLPAEWPAAAECWNEAGAYANGLREAIGNAYDDGWRTAANWMNRDDLHVDIGSPAYEADKAKSLVKAASP